MRTNRNSNPPPLPPRRSSAPPLPPRQSTTGASQVSHADQQGSEQSGRQITRTTSASSMMLAPPASGVGQLEQQMSNMSLGQQRMMSQLQSQTIAPTRGAAATDSTSNNTVSFTQAIDQIVLSPSRRSNEVIHRNIATMTALTQIYPSNSNGTTTYDFCTEDRGNRRSSSHLDMQTSLDGDVFTIESSLRVGYSGPQASDAYLAQLGCADVWSTSPIPSRLPGTIARDPITNDDTRAKINQIMEGFPTDNNGQVSLVVDREQGNSASSKTIHELLTETVNGRSTAYLLQDFNNLTESRVTIDSVTVSRTPTYSLAFNISE